MDAALCLPGTAVTVRAVDEFYEFIDGWHGVVSPEPLGGSRGCIWIDCVNSTGQPVQFLVPPDQLEIRHDETGEN